MHVSIPVIELAMKENISILKFPPHVTDVLQPLDVTCFGSLKRMWEKSLNKWVNQWGPKEPVKKAQFVNLLGEIWHDGLSKPNIQAGFSKMGIFPINRERFPVKRFDPRSWSKIRDIFKMFKIWNFYQNMNNFLSVIHTPIKF